MDAIKEAHDRGVVIVNITQCTKGSVSNAYATGRALNMVGVIPGADMTPEVRCLVLRIMSRTDILLYSVHLQSYHIYSPNPSFQLSKFES